MRLFLPLADPVEGAVETAFRGVRPGAMPGGTETILVVEDDARVRRVTSARLRSLGYQVVEADSAAAALSLLVGHAEIAMIFTDIVMPGGMTGDEMAEAALALRPNVKMLFTSGYAEPAVAKTRSEAGAWLQKPYTAGELAQKVRATLGAISANISPRWRSN